jgi:O-antigen ligase
MATFGICAWVWSAPRPRLNRALKALVPLILIPAAIASVAIANVDLMTGSTHRAYVWGLTLDMIGDRPFLGTGMNSFAGMFASVRPNDLTQLWTKAHDTYLELALDLGIPAAGLLIGAALWLCILCARGVLTRDRDQVLPALGFSATILVGFHALADFSMQIPAVAMTWSVLVGVGVAQSISSRSRRTDARPIEFAGAPAAQGTAKSSALPP